MPCSKDIHSKIIPGPRDIYLFYILKFLYWVCFVLTLLGKSLKARKKNADRVIYRWIVARVMTLVLMILTQLLKVYLSEYSEGTAFAPTCITKLFRMLPVAPVRRNTGPVSVISSSASKQFFSKNIREVYKTHADWLYETEWLNINQNINNKISGITHLLIC